VIAEGFHLVGQLAATQDHLFNRGTQVVIDGAGRYRAKVLESPHVTIEESQLCAAVVKPGEIALREHQSHNEHPGLSTDTDFIHGDLEEVDLGFIARPVYQRNEDFGLLAPALLEDLAYGRDPDLAPPRYQLGMESVTGDALLFRRVVLPFLDDLLDEALSLIADRRRVFLRPSVRWLGLRDVLLDRIAAASELRGDLPNALAFLVIFPSDSMD
jgi:hypothetical protein